MDDDEQLDSVVSKDDDQTAADNIGNSEDADVGEKKSNDVIQRSPVHALLDVINEQEQEQELQTAVKDDGEEMSFAAAADDEAVEPELIAEEMTEAELSQQKHMMDLDEASHDEASDEQLNTMNVLVKQGRSEEVPGEEHLEENGERPEEEELVNGEEREEKSGEPAEDADEVQPVEGGQREEEEEFGDGEDPEIKNVTLDDDGQTVHLEGEEASEGEEKKISQQEGDYLKLEEGEEETRATSVEERDDDPTREELEEDRHRQLSPVISMSPHSYRSDGSARKMEEEGQLEGEEEEEFEEEESKSQIREKLIERYHLALAERQQMQEQNYQLQHKLADYFRRKKADDSRPEDRNMADQEQRYLKCMATLDELRQEERTKYESHQTELDELQRKCAEKEEQVDRERILLMEYKREVALSAINSRTGKPIPAKDVEQYLSAESRKEAEVVTVRLENIKLKNRLRKKEAALKSKEELAEGLHLIDFEQLKIENQTYNEKIEERNEELLKLRRKITSTVQVLTHLKEKLQFVQNANQTEKTELREVEEFVGRRRDNLSRLKQARDALRFDNQNIHQNGGLLGNKALLRDFEDRKDETDELKQKLGQMRMRYAELTLNLNAVRKKIEESKSR